jgi:hypothetical protein
VPISNLSPVGIGDLVLGAVDQHGSRWNLQTFEGWTGSPGTTLELSQRARGHGATSNDPYLTARNMTLGGRVSNRDPEALNASIDDLNAAVALDGFLLAVAETGRVRHCQAARNGEVLTPKVNNRVATFSIQIAAEDPLKYGDLITATTLLPASIGGLTYPATYPVTYTGVSNSGVISVVNTGNTQAPVWLRIDGPIPAGGWTVTHVGKKQSLTFASSLSLTAGEFVTVDMEQREILAQGQAARAGYVTSRGWFSLDPGANDIAFSAQNYSPTAQLTVTTKPAWS